METNEDSLTEFEDFVDKRNKELEADFVLRNMDEFRDFCEDEFDNWKKSKRGNK